MQRTIVATVTAFVCATTIVSASGPKTAANPAAKESSVTLTGCLQADGSRYMLTDLQGVNMPKSRSWKTVYLKKSSKRYEVVSDGSAVKLKEHVGKQVTVTGTPGGGSQVKAKTVKVVTASCS